MKTRIFLLIAIVALGVVWFGISQDNREITIIGIAMIIIGLVGAYAVVSRKTGFNLFRRL